MRLVFAVFLLITLALPADAQPIPGAEAPAFAQARDLWLNGDDLPALQALAGLAREGNTAAQMLLSQIATATWTHAHVTEGMDRRARIALLRQEVGLSGRDWMQAAAESNELAAVNLASRSHEGDPLIAGDRVLRLAIAGEHRLALLELAEMANIGQFDATAIVARIAREDLGIAADLHLAVALDALSRSGPVQIPAGINSRAEFERYLDSLRSPAALFEYGGFLSLSPARELASVWNGTDRGDYLRLAQQSPSLGPLRVFCAERCQDQTESCLLTAGYAMSAYFPAPLEGPSPSLISPEAYQASPRLLRDIEAMLGRSPIRWPGCEG